MYFGGTNGITYFDPELIEIDTFSPPVVLTGLKINFQEIFPGDIYRNDIPLETNINSANTINLHHDDNIFSISFASLDFKNKEKIEYAYIMNGINDDWIKLGTQNFVNFTGLKPGNYQLKVKATNSDGIWNSEIKSINIVISPPWWQTKTFIALLIISLFFAILLIVKRREQNLKSTKDILERKVRERTREISMQKEEIKSQNELIEKQYGELVEKNELIEKQNLKLKNKAIHLEEEIEQRHADLILAKDRAEESDRLKSAFISNISHEIRTPLNAIIGFSNLMSMNALEHVKKQEFVDIIQTNGERLVKIIDDIIEFSRIESNLVEIVEQKFNLNDTIRKIYQFYEPIIKRDKKL
ncbi:MAG: hypothetical protein HC831_14415, partial [Chloroflexia bacterium]|nr:hypothetical protein [Chloroflexia bacterium]